MNHQSLTPSFLVVRIIFLLNRSVLSICTIDFSSLLDQDLTMVLTAAQMTAFFEHADQMGIPHVTAVQLQAEGITSVSDLADFKRIHCNSWRTI